MSGIHWRLTVSLWSWVDRYRTIQVPSILPYGSSGIRKQKLMKWKTGGRQGDEDRQLTQCPFANDAMPL